MIRSYQAQDREAVIALWQNNAQRMGYAVRSAEQLDALLFCHPYFTPRHAFVRVEQEIVRAFICGCTGDDIPRGAERGYFTCLLADAAWETDETVAQLFEALERSFQAAGKITGAVTFFNPMQLPWVMPNTPGFEHNNMPGVAVDLPLYHRMLHLGYQDCAHECAMARDLQDFSIPDAVQARREKAKAKGYTVGLYNADEHTGLAQMLQDLENPDWIRRITAAAEARQRLVVALHGNTVAGFAGPVYPEETGRGYFAGIGVAPCFQHHGLGTLLFYSLCQEEKEAGARYMSLFTGKDNPAKRIYEQAGFRTVREFSVMLKTL